MLERILRAVDAAKRFYAAVSKRVDVDGTKLSHVTDGRRADAERSLAINDDQITHRRSPTACKWISPVRQQPCSQTIPAKELENLDSVLIFDGKPALLSHHDPHDVRVRIAKAIEDRPDGPAERLVEKGPTVDTEQVRARVLEGHALAFVFDSVAPLIVLEIVLQAVEDTSEVFGVFPVAERDELQQCVNGSGVSGSASRFRSVSRSHWE